MIVVVLSLFYVACSSEDAAKNSAPNHNTLRIADPDVITAKNLYINMMASTEYADFRSSIVAFNTKLKQVNRYVSFTQKADWMYWAYDNLGTTDFTDKVEFESMLDDMISKSEDLIKENEDLFEYLADADEDQIAIIVGKQHEDDYDNYIGSTTAQSACDETCLDTADGAWDNAIDVYFYTVNTGMLGINEFADSLAYISAFQTYMMEIECIGSELSTCICTCDPNCIQ